MQAFAILYEIIDQNKKPEIIVEALINYFSRAAEEDKIWALALMCNYKLKRAEKNEQLKNWALDYSGTSHALFDASLKLVGDVVETLTLILPKPKKTESKTLRHYIQLILCWKEKAIEERSEEIILVWEQLNQRERFLFNKLITGSFRIEVPQKLICRALAKATQKEEKTLYHRILRNWDAAQITFDQLIFTEDEGDQLSIPYPFFRGRYLDKSIEEQGDCAEWFAEHRWAGLRVQIIKRKGRLYIWSKHEELITDKIPESEELHNLPDGIVIDGELLAYKNEQPLPFNVLLKRLNKKIITKKIINEVPLKIMSYDLLEWEGVDIRKKTLIERRKVLEKMQLNLIGNKFFNISPILEFNDWKELAKLKAVARENRVQGIILKKKKSGYLPIKKERPWLKWEADPLTIKAVLIYAEVGENRRAELYTNYTFAVWENEVLVPLGKADSGLSDHQFMEISLFIHKNTLERFGPVRSVKAELVFELSFAGLARSARRKSGVLLEKPKILKWLKDIPTEAANSLADIHAMLEEYGH